MIQCILWEVGTDCSLLATEREKPLVCYFSSLCRAHWVQPNRHARSAFAWWFESGGPTGILKTSYRNSQPHITFLFAISQGSTKFSSGHGQKGFVQMTLKEKRQWITLCLLFLDMLLCIWHIYILKRTTVTLPWDGGSLKHHHKHRAHFGMRSCLHWFVC